jgi:hypothetical protein
LARLSLRLNGMHLFRLAFSATTILTVTGHSIPPHDCGK